VLCLGAGSGACVLTQDLPDPALDVPAQYKYAGKGDAPPSLDWWRGFRSAELTQLMQEAQTVNLELPPNEWTPVVGSLSLEVLNGTCTSVVY